MNARERFINYVINGDKTPFVSLQIGAGAGFDCKLAGKEWVSEGTIEDTIRAYEIVECEPLLNIGLPDFGSVVPELAWQSTTEKSSEDVRITYKTLECPYGVLKWKLHEQKKYGTTPVQYPVTVDTANIFDIVCWYANQHVKAVKHISGLLSPIVEKAHKHGAISVQWNIQPFELFGLAPTDTLAMLALLHFEPYRRCCEIIRNINIEIIKEVFACGTDFVFLGAPGVEMLSPQIYTNYIIPDSQKISRAVHDAGGLIYSHICSPIEPFLSNGYYNEMGIDLFETLSPPPVGNVPDLAKARQILNSNICTRGNIGLDILLNGTKEDVEKATISVLQSTKGYKHMVAASDYLFYDIPLENCKTMVRTAKNFRP